MTQDEILEAAFKIAKTLCRDAIWDGDRCNWLGPANDVFFGAVLRGYGALGPNVYDGTAGISLFLAQVAKRTRDPIVTRTAIGAAQHAVQQHQDCPATVALSFYTGHIGIGYAAVQVGQLLGHPDLVTRGRDLILATLNRDHPTTCLLDVMLGTAASIPALIAIQDVLGATTIKEPLLAWGTRILLAADDTAFGLSWDTSSEMKTNAGDVDWLDADHPNLLGYAHGASGIGLALIELGVAFDRADFIRAGKRAFAYEDSWFDQVHQVWPDLRYHNDPTAKQITCVAWCHGAVGIGLARLRADALLMDNAFSAQIDTAKDAVIRALGDRLKPDTNMCLCHGVMGDMDLIIALGQSHRTAKLITDCATLVRTEFLDQDRPLPYGGGDSHCPPGLMLGLAGTGYGLLRLLKENRPASLLCVGAA